MTSTVKQALQESLVQILQPQRRVDMLRDIMDAQRRQRPYVVTFCGVNGVGKSTNLAKVTSVPQPAFPSCAAESWFYMTVFFDFLTDFLLAFGEWLQCPHRRL